MGQSIRAKTKGSPLTIRYHVYFDESGTHRGSPVMTMAGYVFERRQAKFFSREWQKDIKRLGISHAHMTDCALGFGEYEKLSMNERIRSEELLIKCIKKRSMYGLSVSIVPQQFENIMKDVPFCHSAYTFLVLLSVNKIREYIKTTGQKGRVSYFFESGHQKAAEANNFMNAIPRFGWTDYYSYSGHCFVDKRIELPLQAADMLAWQHRHYLIRSTEGHYQPRKDFIALMREQDDQATVEAHHIRNLRDMLTLSKSAIERSPSDFMNQVMELFTIPRFNNVA